MLKLTGQVKFNKKIEEDRKPAKKKKGKSTASKKKKRYELRKAGTCVASFVIIIPPIFLRSGPKSFAGEISLLGFTVHDFGGNTIEPECDGAAPALPLPLPSSPPSRPPLNATASWSTLARIRQVRL